MAVDLSDAPLRTLLSNTMFRRWAVANLFARLPLTMNLLALVLVGEVVTGNLATGATLAGILTLTSGLLAQPRGRQLDRVELRGGLRRDLLLAAAVMLGIAAAAMTGAPIWVLGVLAAAEGAASAAVLGGFRALLVPTVSADEIEPANALDAVFVEVAFVAGPAVAGAAALVVGPIGVLFLQALAFGVGALLLGGLPTRPPAPDLNRAGTAPLRTRGARSVYLLAFGPGLALGAWEASMPARLDAFGWEPASAGPLLALTALGSGLAGLAVANARDPLRRGRALVAVLLGVFALSFVPTAVAGSVAVLAVALFVVGMPIAPLNAIASLAIQRIVAEPRQAEGFALYPAMILIGAGTGQAVAGVALDLVAPATFILAIALVPLVLALFVAAAILRRRALGVPSGVGCPHDPVVADPAIPAVGGVAP
jgi:MFS family permease